MRADPERSCGTKARLTREQAQVELKRLRGLPRQRFDSYPCEICTEDWRRDRQVWHVGHVKKGNGVRRLRPRGRRRLCGVRA